MPIPRWHDPAEPCPEWPHFNQSAKGKDWFAVGCSRCDVGWKWGPYNDQVYSGKPFLKWLKENRRRLPDGTTATVKDE